MTPKEKMRLAEAAMHGDKEALTTLGNPTTLGELDAIMRDAFEAMTADEQAANAREAERQLNQIDRTKS